MGAYSDTFEQGCVRRLAANVLKIATNDAKDGKDFIQLRHWFRTSNFDMWCSAAQVGTRSIKKWFYELWGSR